jgi:hypothetical protein
VQHTRLKPRADEHTYSPPQRPSLRCHMMNDRLSVFKNREATQTWKANLK